MKILHTSDLHGALVSPRDHAGAHSLAAMMATDFDLWVDTGDFFPNRTRGIVEEEVQYQTLLAAQALGALVEVLGGRTLVCVGGNHDYVDLAALVREAGGSAHNVGDGPVSVNGLRFAGFREVPWIAGEWNGETHDFSDIVEKAMGEDPEVLLTHGPPAGILDYASDGRPGGVASLTNRLMYSPHRVKAHLFGHIHEKGGATIEQGGILFSNAATRPNLLEVGPTRAQTERAILERGYAEGVESMRSDIREMKRCEPWRTR